MPPSAPCGNDQIENKCSAFQTVKVMGLCCKTNFVDFFTFIEI